MFCWESAKFDDNRSPIKCPARVIDAAIEWMDQSVFEDPDECFSTILLQWEQMKPSSAPVSYLSYYVNISAIFSAKLTFQNFARMVIELV